MSLRQQPLLVRGPMTGKVYVILRYKRNALGDIAVAVLDALGETE